MDRLLEHPAYGARMAAMSILDFKARRRLEDGERRELFRLYLDRHDRITTWDMVDRAAPRVVGGYLAGRAMEPLRELAAAPDPAVHNAVGIFLKHAGTRDQDALHRFLAAHATSMPRPALRLATEKLDPDDRARYMA